VRAAFYYPWFPETWTVNGSHVFYKPDLGYYDSRVQSTLDAHTRAMDYAKVQVAIVSWWGATSPYDGRIRLLLDRIAALGSPLRVAFYYEKEGFGNPSQAQNLRRPELPPGGLRRPSIHAPAADRLCLQRRRHDLRGG
jgi:hypothetical protein